jgi:hypothetical protein
MQPDSPLMRLARITLKRDPVEWIATMRQADMTWQGIADELSARLDVPVSRETVRLWASVDTEAAS